MSKWGCEYRCTMCHLYITWDGGYQQWVHWWNGSIYCPEKTASIIGIPDEALSSKGDDA